MRIRLQDRRQAHPTAFAGAHQGRHRAAAVASAIADASPLPAQMSAEIKIHRSLLHERVVRFEGFFEDDANVYILLEMCAHQVRARDAVTAADAA